MRRALLLYNPVAGRNPARRQRELDLALNILRAGGVDARTEPLESATSAATQAQQAIVAGYDAVIACGGDGTMHAVLQGMVGASATLGVLPAGTEVVISADSATGEFLIGFVLGFNVQFYFQGNGEVRLSP